MTVACLDCGTLQELPAEIGSGRAACRTCDAQFQRTTWRSRRAALVAAWAGLALVLTANVFPLAQVTLLGAVHRSYLASGPEALWGEGFPAIAIVILMFAMVLPALRFGLLITVLHRVRRTHRPAWLGQCFRWAVELETWAMPDVAVLGFWVAQSRMAAIFPLSLGAGAYALMGAGFCTLLTRALLDKRAVWLAIAPDRDASEEATLSCGACDLVLPAFRSGRPCPRCGETLSRRKPDALKRAAALILAGLILYPAANVLPTFSIVQYGAVASYTILGGAIEIAKANLLGLAILVVVASFAIPMLKLASLGWFLASVQRRSPHRLRLKTRLYRVVDEIGRWSMVDPLTISFIVPLLSYGHLTSSHANAGTGFFTAVVVLTMLATRAFDPRLMWDAAQGRPV